MAKSMPAHQWWATYGGQFSELQRLSIRILAMISGAGACERTWPAYGFVHSKKRNRLSPKRANDLVYVFTNMRLQKKARLGEVFAEWECYSDEE